MICLPVNAWGQVVITYPGAKDYFNPDANFLSKSYEIEKIIKLNDKKINLSVLQPTSIVFIDDDNIMVNDFVNGNFHHFNLISGKKINTYGKEGSYAGYFNNPINIIKLKNENYVVSDSGNNRIQFLDKDFISLDYFGYMGDRKDWSGFAMPYGLAANDKRLFVADRYNNIVKVYSIKSKKFKYTIGYNRFEPKKSIKYPTGIAIFEDEIAISDFGNDRISFYSTNKATPGIFKNSISSSPFTPLKIHGPMGLTYDPFGNLYISDSENSRITRMNRPFVEGTIDIEITDCGDFGKLIHPVDIKLNSRGEIAVLDDIHRIIIIYRADYFKKARILYEKLEFEKAIPYLKRAINNARLSGSENVYALFYLGQSLEMLGNFEESYEVYNSIIKLFSSGTIRSNAKFRAKILKPLLKIKKGNIYK